MDLFWILVGLSAVLYLIIGYIITIAAHAVWYTINGWDYYRGDSVNPLEIVMWILFVPTLVIVFIIPDAIKAYRINTKYWERPRKEKLQVRLVNRGIRSLRKILPKTIIKVD